MAVFRHRAAARTVALPAGLGLLAAVVAAIAASRAAAVIVLALGVGLAAVRYLVAAEYLVECDQQGLTVTQSDHRGDSSTSRHNWSDVIEIRYDEPRVLFGPRPGRVVVVTSGGRLFEYAERDPRQFNELITLLGRATPRLPYVWVHRGSAPPGAALLPDPSQRRAPTLRYLRLERPGGTPRASGMPFSFT